MHFSLRFSSLKVKGVYYTQLNIDFRCGYVHHHNQTKLNIYIYILKTIQIRRARHGEVRARSKRELISDVLLWTPSHGPARVGWPATNYLQSVLIQDVAWKTYREQWTIGKSGGRGSRKSVQAACHNDIYLN